MAAPLTRAAVEAVLASLLAAVTSLDASDYTDTPGAGWTASRGHGGGSDLADRPLQVSLALGDGATGPRQGVRLFEHALTLSWPMRLRQGDDLGSQAQTLAAILAAAGAVHAWGDAASGARALPGGYKLFTIPDAAGWLRVELSVSLLLPWR